MNSNNNKPELQKSEQQKVLDNRVEQLNPTIDKYWQARSFNKRPKKWEVIIADPKKTN
jgi:hypothetical protein